MVQLTAAIKIGHEVRRRSLNACEAMVEMPRTRARCGISPVEDHHMLPRSRGGDILDSLGETYHHLALCRQHHKYAHESVDPQNNLLIQGYVYIDGGKVVYTGSDEYLTRKYGREAEQSR